MPRLRSWQSTVVHKTDVLHKLPGRKVSGLLWSNGVPWLLRWDVSAVDWRNFMHRLHRR